MPSAFIDMVKNAGIVGAGGAGFPAHVKYDAKVEIVIANGAECEPLLHCDQLVMRLYAREVVSGLKMVMQNTGALRGAIALKGKYHRAVEALREAAFSEPSISVFELENFYPAGDEQVIVYEVTGRIVPEGGIPLNVGVLVANVSSLMNVHRAKEGHSVTSRWLTLNGAVKNPYTAELPVGLSFREAISIAGGAAVADYVVVSGGPMMGKIASEDDSITKTTSGILIFPSDHPHVKRITQKGDSLWKRTKSVCDQCMACTEICPRFLLGHELKPHRLMRSLAYGLSDSDTTTSSFLCCECGVCSYYACPLYLSPGLVNAYIKKSLSSKGIRNNHKKTPLDVRVFRNERKLPVSRLVKRIGISRYASVEVPFLEVDEKRFNTVKIPLSQHIGAPAEPVVKPGITVKKGDCIGRIPEGKLGAAVHASIDGTVTNVTNDYIEIQR